MQKLVSITSNAEKTIAYCARVSNPRNQNSDNIEKLLSYCIKNNHWSIFEQANLIIEIQTSRAISPQILRHRSFTFQEFSQRYSETTNKITYQARRQDIKNRQNSIDDLNEEVSEYFIKSQEEVWSLAYDRYQNCLEKGIAKECARFLLPSQSMTRLYMNGTVRSWIHYIELRSGNGTQIEHQEIANQCKEIFSEELPIIASSLGVDKLT